MYAVHVNLAAAKPWQFKPNWKDCSTVEFIIFSCLKFRFCLSTVANIMIILKSSALGHDVIGVYRWILPKSKC